MAIRSLARQRALQFLYALEFSRQSFEETEASFIKTSGARWRKGWDEFTRNLAKTTYEKRKELDADISKTLKNWKIERLPITDRICLRMALCEFREFPDIPLRVTMDEYIDLARLFGTDESPQFVNGVLETLSKEFRHKDFTVEKNEPQ